MTPRMGLLGTEWGSNPETVTAIVATATGLILAITAVIVVFQLREDRKAREADVLLKLLEQFGNDFLPTGAYERLLAQARALVAAGTAKDWTGPLDEDEMRLVKLIKLYGVVGLLLDEGLVRPAPLMSFICQPLRYHYRDLRPFIETSTSKAGVESLHCRCERDFFRNGKPGRFARFARR